jgi:hypothetical protein
MMSEFRIFCIGAVWGAGLFAVATYFAGPAKDGPIANLFVAMIVGVAAVAVFGKPSPKRQASEGTA